MKPLLSLLFLSTLLLQADPLGEEHIYKHLEESDLKLFIKKPTDGTASEKRPAIVWFHGGGWTGGSPKQFDAQAQHFIELEFVCILPEYRLIKDIPGPPVFPCRDAKSAMRWVRSHARELGVDPDRIAAAGGSAGGILPPSLHW